MANLSFESNSITTLSALTVNFCTFTHNSKKPPKKTHQNIQSVMPKLLYFSKGGGAHGPGIHMF